MKKKYFSLCLIVLAVGVKSQVLTYVGGGASVTIKENTLFYNGGGFEVAAHPSLNATTVNNYGNIMISGGVNDEIKIASQADNVNFTIEADVTGAIKYTKYGQLYITGIPQSKISGVVTKVHVSEFVQTAGRQQLGLPFYNFKVSDFSNFISGANFTNISNNSSGRFSNTSVFWWNNARARFDQIAVSGSAYDASGNPNPSFINAMTYYVLPHAATTNGDVGYTPAGGTSFVGIPVSDTDDSNVKFNLTGAYSGSFGTNGNGTNYFGENFYSYLNDPFRSGGSGYVDSWDSEYALNLYQLANPFLTNIDLSFIATNEAGALSDDNYISNLEGVAYYGNGAVARNPTTGTTYTDNRIITVKTVEGTGVFQGGDVGNRLTIRPMGVFMVKLRNSTPATLDLRKTRRFNYNARNESVNYDVTAARATNSSNEVVVPDDKIVKQVAVVLYDYDNKEIARTYYAVYKSGVTGNGVSRPSLQAYNKEAAIYTKEELVGEGGEDLNYSYKLYINEANEIDFKSKEIPLFVNYDLQPYKLGFEIYELGRKVSSLFNGNSFYIKDNEGNIVKIQDDTVLSMSGTQRLGLYYEKPESGTLSTENTVKGQTIIGKKDNKWNVRFAKNWNNATIEIYSVAGQLLSSLKNVSTSQDYVIPYVFQGNSMYLIKAISNNGEVVIKKIIN